MIPISRLLKIVRVTAKYRLDQLLPDELPWLVKLLLIPFYLFPQNRLTRGERLRRACEELGPIFVKFGQLLSTRPDVVPADIVIELNQLQDNVPPFAADQFCQIVETELNGKVSDIFASYDKQPLASASVAQIHTAVLHNGQQVIIKVIRPGIEKIIQQDLQLLTLVARLVEKLSRDGKRLRPVEIVHDYRSTILDELDLQREAANAAQLRRHFLNSPLLYVPEVYWDYCRPNVLVMERIYGIPVTDIAALKAQQTDMKKLAERGVEIFFTQVFEHNFFHADMHPGNIFVAHENPMSSQYGRPQYQGPKYIAVDMAIMGSLTRADQYYLARNLLAMFRRDYRKVAELHVQSGWVPKRVKVEELEAAIRTVCEPIFARPLKDISFAQVLLNLFRTARRFDMEVQPQLVLLQKTLLNVEGLGRQLYPDLDLWQTAHPFLEKWLRRRFHPKTLWRELKHIGPEWLEKFPQVPDLIFNGLQAIPRLSANLDQALSKLSHNQSRNRPGAIKKMLGFSLIGVAGVVLLQDIQVQGAGIAQLLHQVSPSCYWLFLLGLAILWR